MKRKKSLRKVRKNRSGNPLYTVREDIGTFVDGENEFSEINIVSSLSGFTVTLHNTRVPHLDRPIALEASCEWKAYDWLYAPTDEFSLVRESEKLVAVFREKIVPSSLRLRQSRFPSVIV